MKLPPFNKSFTWIVLILALKLLFLFLCYLTFYPANGQMEGLVFVNKDFAEFYNPIENLVSTGTYSMDGSTAYTGRMPGYFFPGILFRVLFSRAVTLHLVAGFQLIFSASAIYFLARMLFDITKHNVVFIATIMALSCFSYFFVFDVSFHPGSVSISAYIFSIYFFYRFSGTGALKFLFFSGVFLAWIFFLRPFLITYFIAFIVSVFVFNYKTKGGLKGFIKLSCILFLPLLFVEGVWISRNYLATGRIIPLQTTFAPGEKSEEYSYSRNDKYSLQQLRTLIFAWGGDNLWYIKGSEMSWFTDRKPSNSFPNSAVLCKACNTDSLVRLKEDISKSFSPSLNKAQHDSLDKIIIEKCNRYREGFVQEKKMRYLFVSPFLRMRNLVYRNVTMDWPGPSFSNSGIFYKALKLISLAVYAMVTLGGVFFAVSSLFFRRRIPVFSLATLNLAGILITFAFVINFAHHHYFFTGFISCFIICAIGFSGLADWLKPQRKL